MKGELLHFIAGSNPEEAYIIIKLDDTELDRVTVNPNEISQFLNEKEIPKVVLQRTVELFGL